MHQYTYPTNSDSVYAMYFFFPAGMLHDLKRLRTANPKLRLLVSLGGRALKAAAFSALVADDDRMANLTQSISDLYRSVRGSQSKGSDFFKLQVKK